MRKDPLPFSASDISALAKSLSREIRALPEPPGHVQMLNVLARAAGYKNYQAMKAQHDARERLDAPPAQPDPIDHLLIERTARYFDAAGRLATWPSKQSQQRLCLWVLWSRIPAETEMSERQVSDLLKADHLFGDHVLLRRDMVDMGLLSRTRDGRVYRRVERPPEPEAAVLIGQLTRRLTA
jgi:hypothetical protein